MSGRTTISAPAARRIGRMEPEITAKPRAVARPMRLYWLLKTSARKLGSSLFIASGRRLSYHRSARRTHGDREGRLPVAAVGAAGDRRRLDDVVVAASRPQRGVGGGG